MLTKVRAESEINANARPAGGGQKLFYRLVENFFHDDGSRAPY